MLKHMLMILAVAVLLTGIQFPAYATTIIDFETLSDADPVTNQFTGLTFTNTTAITAGISLNEFEFRVST